MLKILNITFTTRWGGLEQAFLNYKEALEKQEIKVIPVIHKNSAIKSFLEKNFSYKLMNFSKYDPVTFFCLKKIIREEKPDFIFTHGNRAHYLTKKACGKVPVIGTAHGYSFEYITKCDYIFAVSNDIRNELINTGYSQNRVFYIPNMIKIDHKISYNPPKKFDVPIIGVMARIEKEKGVDIFIKALDLLKKSNVQFKAVIAGTGSEFENIKQLIRELKLEEQIDLLGFVADKAKFYRNINILCLPSLMEPFGIVILESFLFSKPVIASNASGPAEIIKNKIDGLIVEKGNYIELADAITYLINNQKFIPSITEKAFEKLGLYDMNNVSLEIFKILQQMTNR